MPLTAPFINRKPRIWPGGLGVPSPPPIEFDAAVSDEHGVVIAWTGSPIENGQFVTDHGNVLPGQVKMDVVVTVHTDTLVPNVQSTRHIRLYHKLEALSKRKEPFDLETSVRISTGLVFDRVRLPRRAGGGEQSSTYFYVISCEMHKVEIATVDVAEAMAEAAQEIALGAQDAGAVAGAVVT